MKDQNKSIDLTPSWEFATAIYIAVLDNPEAPPSSKDDAREELMRLARMVDAMKGTNS